MIVDSNNLSALAWNQAWHIAVLALVVGCANVVVGRRWPHLAYALWLIVLAKCFMPPFVSSPVAIWHDWTPSAEVPSDSSRALAIEASAANASLRFPHSVIPAVESTNSSTNLTKRAAQPASQMTREIAQQAAPFVWLAGSVLLLGFAAGRSSYVTQRLRRTSQPIDEDLHSQATCIAGQIGLRRVPCVLQTTSNIGPLAAGILRPTVYVPTFLLERSSPGQIASMLMHELTHIRRCDNWVALLQFTAQIVWWFHPFVWWMNCELTRQRERCCDEEVVAHLAGKRADYARLLVRVVEAQHRLEPLWGYPAVRPAELTRRRLEEIMKRSNMVHVRTPRWCWLISIACAILVLPGSDVTVASGDDRTAADVRLAQNVAAPSANTRTGEGRPPALLSYGDGKADGKKSYGGSGHMIRFQMPEGVTKVRGLRIHGSRYGLPQAPDEAFEITFLSDDREETLDTQSAPYRLFKRGKESWVRVMFDKEVELPTSFWVVLNFNAERTKGVYVSYDTSTKGEHSRVGLPGDDEEPKPTDFGGDWMVQVMLARQER